MMAASTDFRPEQVPNANYTRVPDFRQCPLLALKNDRAALGIFGALNGAVT